MTEGLTTNKTKKEILKYTDVLTQSFSSTDKTDILAICQDEGISIITDNYNNYFDGMLVWDGTSFHIHINSHKGNRKDNNRGRFTIAHELGHYFIEGHREGIKNGSIPMHASNNSLVHSDKIEFEADYFAANLLMPKEVLRNFTGRRKFSLEVIKEFSERFGVSLTAAALRFVEVGTHEVMIVFSKNNQVKWSFRSDDFPKLANKFRRNGPLPKTSVAGESFLKSGAQYTGVESMDLEDWFEYRGWEPGRQLFEQCFYSDQYDYIISLVWFQ